VVHGVAIPDDDALATLIKQLRLLDVPHKTTHREVGGDPHADAAFDVQEAEGEAGASWEDLLADLVPGNVWTHECGGVICMPLPIVREHACELHLDLIDVGIVEAQLD
jgi:hypothetical protein